MRRIALATAAALPALDEDGPALVAALAERGVSAVPTIWDDGAVAWDAYDAVVVRSTWDYVPRRNAFLAWAERVGSLTSLWNAPALLRWNTDKRYLAELRAL